jgi:PAS domain S-box-containing protein
VPACGFLLIFLLGYITRMGKNTEGQKVASGFNEESSSRELRQVRDALDKSAIVAVTDKSGNIIYVNNKFCEISKYNREELIGKNHRIINSGYHAKEFFSDMWKCISSGALWEGEIRNRAKDGSYYWVHTTIVPFTDEQGSPYQYVSIRYEITQRKQAEEQLRSYAEQLEQSNTELARSTKAVLEREAQILVQDRLASVGLLASSLAHEIGTPLGVIRGRAEYLEMKLDDPNVKKSVEVIVTQIDRVSKLIRSLLNLARGEQAHTMELVRVDIVLLEVLELMAHEFRKNSIEIRNEIADMPVSVKAESGPLHQVLLNLFVNSVHAIQAAQKNGRERHFIRISFREEGESLVIALEDSGCGISSKNLKKLFQPFFTTKDIGVGTGLGLATSYRILESWGGRIDVTSAEGEGATFQLRLPKT